MNASALTPEARPWTHRLLCLGVVLLLCTGCGKPAYLGVATGEFPLVEPGQRPEDVLSFSALFDQNCRACHGPNGRKGAAPPLNDPLFLALVPETVLQDVIAHGRSGTLMPAFGRDSGGSLTDEQIEILVKGLHEPGKDNDWKKAESVADVPRYLLKKDKEGRLTGDAKLGEMVFLMACANCHGKEGKGSSDVGAINQPAFLQLMSDQELRRIVITGWDELGMPGYASRPWKDYTPLTSDDIDNVVAYVASWRRIAAPRGAR